MSNFPPKRYVLTESAIEGIQVFLPKILVAKETPEDYGEIVEFSCPQCNATTAYCAENGGLTCTYCHYFEPPPHQTVGKDAEEFELNDEIIERLAHGWGVERKELTCNRCGAQTTLAPDMLTHSCPFCGSNHVIQQKAAQDILRPRFLIPFSVTQEECLRNTAVWLENSWMLPPDLKKMARVADFTAIFIPFWTIDMLANATWRFEIMEKDSTNDESKWVWHTGEYSIRFDDLLYSGTDKISSTLIRKLRSFNLNKLVPYNASYLAGTQAQAYDIPLNTTWLKAQQKMRKAMDEAARRKTGLVPRNFSMSIKFEEEKWRYILVPIYLTTYRYNNRVWQIIVQGDNGKVVGQRPVDWKFVGFVLFGIFIPTICFSIITVLTQIYRPIAAYNPLFSFLAFVTGILAIIASLILLFTGRGMDDV